MATGGQARNHHWVPQCYLKGFAKSRSKNAQLFVVDAMTRKTFVTVPRNVASARDFNRVEVAGMSPDHVEAGYSHFEGQVSQALHRMCESRQVGGEEDHNLILNLIALLAVRNPRMRENWREFQQRVAKQIMDLTVATKERYKSSLARAVKAGFVESNNTETYESVREFVENDRYTIEVPTTRHVEDELRIVNVVLPLLGQRHWLLVRALPDTGGFVTTDHPVVLEWSARQNGGHFQSPGFGLRGTEVVFPVSHELAMVGTFEGPSGTVDAGVRQVALVNGVIIANGHRQMYARDDRFRYMLGSGEVRRGSDVLRDMPTPRT